MMKEKQPNQSSSNQSYDKPLISLTTRKRKILFYVLILFTSLIINGLYYGVFSFITSVLVDIYAIPQDISIYVSTIVPIVIVLGPLITISSCEKHKDFVGEGIKYLFMLAPLPIMLALLYDKSMLLFIAMALVYLVFTNGIRIILTNVIAFKMKDFINVASFSALTNAFASVAASIWPLVIALVKDNGGWGATYWTLTVMTITLLLVTIIIDRGIKIVYKKDNNGEILEK